VVDCAVHRYCSHAEKGLEGIISVAFSVHVLQLKIAQLSECFIRSCDRLWWLIEQRVRAYRDARQRLPEGFYCVTQSFGLACGPCCWVCGWTKVMQLSAALVETTMWMCRQLCKSLPSCGAPEIRYLGVCGEGSCCIIMAIWLSSYDHVVGLGHRRPPGTKATAAVSWAVCRCLDPI
jgi:hypothetical protein